VLDGLRGMSSLLLETEDAGYLLQVCRHSDCTGDGAKHRILTTSADSQGGVHRRVGWSEGAGGRKKSACVAVRPKGRRCSGMYLSCGSLAWAASRHACSRQLS
jgi:hypothetical protein